jgi:hypothetical protein
MLGPGFRVNATAVTLLGQLFRIHRIPAASSCRRRKPWTHVLYRHGDAANRSQNARAQFFELRNCSACYDH